jgi:membrane dipeptidase
MTAFFAASRAQFGNGCRAVPDDRLGVRSMTLAHFQNNIFADSMTDQPRHGGLSARGKELVHEMNRMGMMVDVSHVSDQAVRDAVHTSRAPVIASHSSSKSIAAIPRNMPDDVIRAVAGKGGVICINFHAGYLNAAAHEVYIRNRPKRDAEIKAAGSDCVPVICGVLKTTLIKGRGYALPLVLFGGVFDQIDL